MNKLSRTRWGYKPTKKSERDNERQNNRALRKAPVVTRRALEKSGFPECLDREIEELDRTEKRLANRFPDLFG